MKNELDLNKETNTWEEVEKCKTCGQYFPTSTFKIINYKNRCNSSYCKFCRTQKQMKSQNLKD